MSQQGNTDNPLRWRANQLIHEATELVGMLDLSDEDPRCGRAIMDSAGWLASAEHLLETVFPRPHSAHRRAARAVVEDDGQWLALKIGKLASILRAMESDIEQGVVASVEDSARGEVFDTLLDHAVDMLGAKRQDVAGVIAGVAFEDCIRRACEKNEIPQKDVDLEQLIVALTKRGLMNSVKAQRARGAAALRTKATHAQWEAFSASDVEATITLTRELVDRLLMA